jgi:ribosomal protein L20A (L18A)
MTQALYAHMNNKRKKKRPSIQIMDTGEADEAEAKHMENKFK